jgi:hypothetical protein
MLTEAARARLLEALLRLAGCVTATAFFAVLLPPEWMAASHAWLGLGEFPRAPVVDYLARSAAALYGFHGLLVLLVSTDPVRHRTFVSFVAFVNITFGVMLLAIDLYAGMPWWWTAGEGPLVIAFGAVIALLNAAPAETRG